MRIKRNPNWTWLLVAVVLMLAYLGTRWHAVLQFPYFLDEIDHIDWAVDLYNARPFTGATNGKLFGLWWMALFDLQGPASIGVVRLVTSLFTLPVVALLLSLGRRLAAPWVGVLAGLAYLAAPYALFYDRLALMDPYVVTWVLASAWFGVRYAAGARPLDAVVSGLCVTGAILAKATGITSVVVPLLAVLLLGRLTWGQRLRGALWSLGAWLVSWGAAYAVLLWRGYNYFGTARSVVGTDDTSGIVGRTLNNIGIILQIDALYFSAPVVIGAILLAGVLIAQRWRLGLALLGMMALPLGGLLVFAEKMSARYWHFHVPFFILIALVGLHAGVQWLEGRRPWAGYGVAALLMGAWLLLFALPFGVQYHRDATALTLPRLDRLEYIESDAAGYALADVAAHLAQATTTQTPPPQIVGVLANCGALAAYVPPTVALTCMPLNITPQSLAALDAALDDQMRRATDQGRPLWVVYETHPIIAPRARTTWDAQVRFQRPGARTTIIVYDAGAGVQPTGA